MKFSSFSKGGLVDYSSIGTSSASNAEVVQKAIDTFEAIRAIDGEIYDLRDRITELYKTAGEFGCNVPAIREMVRRAKKDPDDVAQMDRNLERYEEALARIDDLDRGVDDDDSLPDPLPWEE